MKKSIIFVVIFFSFALNASFTAGKIFAANAMPTPIPVPCSDEEIVNGIKSWHNPEFNSQRPYQASPCRDAPYAAMCGNNISVVVDHVSTDYCGKDYCPPQGKDAGVQTKHVVIDLSNVKLPILGNTQNVVNSQDVTDSMDNAQKVNNYTAWYLNGVNQKAEYGSNSIDDVINYSGPQKKILPSTIQEFIRFQSLYNAGVKNPINLSPQDGEGIKDDNTKAEGVQTEQTANHNQIVVCTTNNIEASFLGVKITIPWIGEERAIPCYDGKGKAQGNVYRLEDWWGGKQAGLIPSKDLIPNWNPYLPWTYTTPPFP